MNRYHIVIYDVNLHAMNKPNTPIIDTFNNFWGALLQLKNMANGYAILTGNHLVAYKTKQEGFVLADYAFEIWEILNRK